MASTLTAGATFDTDRAGSKAEISYHSHVMPPRSATAKTMPFCLVKARGFTLHPSQRRQIELLYGLYQDDRDKAMDDLETLEGLLIPLTRRGNQWPVGWKITDVSGWGGDRETGVQPHPEYYYTVLLDFVGPATPPR
jgi:hypothetical protein